jgi:hypothetical protein
VGVAVAVGVGDSVGVGVAVGVGVGDSVGVGAGVAVSITVDVAVAVAVDIAVAVAVTVDVAVAVSVAVGVGDSVRGAVDVAVVVDSPDSRRDAPGTSIAFGEPSPPGGARVPTPRATANRTSTARTTVGTVRMAPGRRMSLFVIRPYFEVGGHYSSSRWEMTPGFTVPVRPGRPARRPRGRPSGSRRIHTC